MIARRVFGDGRTRAYAWGRAVAREDVAAAAERLIAMSGQFEQRRLARASFQLDVLDAFCGAEQAERRREAQLAWRELVASRRRYEELTRDADAVASRLAELQALVAATEGMAPGDEQELLARRERLRHAEELAEAASAAAAAIAPDEGEGAASLAALAERALAPLERIAPELGATAEELRDLTVRLREAGSDLHRFVASLDSEPGALETVEERLQEIADLRRRFAASSYDELLELSAAAARELESTADGGDPVEAARQAVARAEERIDRACPSAPRRARGERETLRRSRRGRARLARDGRGRVPRRAPGARARADGRRRGDVPHPAERGPPVRADRGHGLRRRALAGRARARGGGRRRDARVRRDRRGHRRRDRTRGRRDAPAPRGASAGAHDHAPPADRERRRHALPRREGSGRSDAHADRGARRPPASRGDRAHGRRRRVHRDAGGRDRGTTPRVAPYERPRRERGLPRPRTSDLGRCYGETPWPGTCSSRVVSSPHWGRASWPPRSAVSSKRAASPSRPRSSTRT